MQTVLVIAAILLSIGYATYRLREALLSTDDPCRHCNGCDLKKNEKYACEKKKAEKFGR